MKHVIKTRIPRELVRARVRQLGHQIKKDSLQLLEQHRAKAVTFVCILKGAVLFTADLMKHLSDETSTGLELSTQLEFVRAASYHGAERSDKITIDFQLLDPRKITGNIVVLVDDVLDTGVTLHTTWQQLKSLEPAALHTAVMLRKRDKQYGDCFLNPDYVGFTIPNAYVVGYGLDYHGRYRHHQHISELYEGAETFPAQHFNDTPWNESLQEYLAQR